MTGLLSDREFCRSLSSQQVAELASLQREGNAQLLGEALAALGRSLEQSGQESSALRLDATAAESFPEQSFFRQRYNALSGIGPWQERVETLARRFVRQATDPAMLFSFAVAGGIAATVRSATLASLALRGGGLLSRGLGARMLAGGAAYVAEIPAFVGACRLWRWGVDGEAPESSLSRELAAAGLFLGVLKLSGAAGSGLSRLTRNPALRLTGNAVTGLGGVYLAHRLQESAGMRSAQDDANRWVDSADAYLQMLVGGRLLGNPAASAALEASLARAAAPQRALTRAEPLTLELGLQRALAPSYEEPSIPSRNEGPDPAPFELTPTRSVLIDRYDVQLLRRLLPEIQGAAQQLSVSPASLEDLFLRSEIQSPEVAEAGWLRLNHALQHSASDPSVGSYFNALLRRIAAETIQANQPKRFHYLFSALHRGLRLEEFEQFAAAHLPGQDLFHRQARPQALAPRSSIIDLAARRGVDALPLQRDAKEILREYFLRGGSAETRLLSRARDNMTKHAELGVLFDRALRQAWQSPVSNLRIERLLRVMGAEEPWYPKLLELTDPDIRIRGYRWDGVLADVEAGFLETQDDAYMADPRIHGILREFHNEWAQGLRRVFLRALPRPPMDAIEGYFPTPRPINPRELIEVLAQLRDPISSQIVRAFRSGEFQLRIVDDAEFERIARHHRGGTRSRFWSGFTARADPSYPMTQIVLRQIRNVSAEVFPRMVFERLVTLIHEYDHHLYASEAASPSLRMLEEEMSAHLRHMQFRMRHGNRQQTVDLLRRSPLGLAMYLRDRIEAVYLAAAPTPTDGLRPLEPLGPAAASREQRLEEAFDRSQRLLDFSLDQSLELLRQGRLAGELRGRLQESLAEAGQILEEQRLELRRWIQESDPEIPPPLEAAGLRYAALFRSQENLVLALDGLDREPTAFGLTLLRRRFDWVLNEGGLARDWDWDAVPWVRRRAEAAPIAPDRRAWGRFLLESFHPHPTEEDFALFEEVASGPIRDREITFDLDDTLGDTVARNIAYQMHEKVPQRYDQEPGQAVHQHQRIRMVYRHMTSLLLGLWAAGNRLRLLTASDNYPGNHDAFFNDNPAFKVAFGLNAPETPEEWLRSSDLKAAPRFLDRTGFQEAFTREFGGPQGRAFLEGIRRERGLERLPLLGSGKIPLADFPFEVLVDDSPNFDQEMRAVGLGERWVPASQNGWAQWQALLEFFFRPREGASESWRRWWRRGSP